MTEADKCPIMDGVLKEIVFNWMEDNKVDKLVASFNGEGDSGSFDDNISIFAQQVHGVAYEALYKSLTTSIVSPTPAGMQGEVTLEQFIVHLSIQIEDESENDINWWDNDGGNGTVEWILDGEGEDDEHYVRGICLTVNQRYTEFTSHHFSIRNRVDQDAPAPELEPEEEP